MNVSFFVDSDKSQIENFFGENDFWKYEGCAAPGAEDFTISRWQYIGVAKENEEVLGFIRFSIEKNSNYIGNVYVKKSHRGIGVCTALFKFAEKKLRMASDHNSTYLYTLQNPIMEKFLRKNKWKCVGVYKNHCYFNGKWQHQSCWQKKL